MSENKDNKYGIKITAFRKLTTEKIEKYHESLNDPNLIRLGPEPTGRWYEWYNN